MRVLQAAIKFYAKQSIERPQALYVIWTLIWNVIYFGTGAAFYMTVEGWSMWESLYFLMVTASTVGYGDLFPTTAGSEAFTIIYIFFGIIVVFARLSDCVSQIFRPIFSHARDAIERAFPQPGIDIDGDGTEDFKVPRDALTYYAKNMSGPIISITIIQILFAFIFVSLVPDLTFGRAFYHCLVTITTVGYGDVSLPNDDARMFSFFHIAVSVSLLAALLTDVKMLAEDRTMKLKKLELVRGRLDIDLMKSLDKDNNGVTKDEFVLGMLQKLKVVQDSELELFQKLFDQMDADKSGILTEADMEQSRVKRPKEVEALANVVEKELGISIMRRRKIPMLKSFGRVSIRLTHKAHRDVAEVSAVAQDGWV